jgi:hypothetical protein
MILVTFDTSGVLSSPNAMSPKRYARLPSQIQAGQTTGWRAVLWAAAFFALLAAVCIIASYTDTFYQTNQFIAALASFAGVCQFVIEWLPRRNDSAPRSRAPNN